MVEALHSMMQWIDQAAVPLLVLLLIAAAGGFFLHERWHLPVRALPERATLRIAQAWGVLGLLAALLFAGMLWSLGQGPDEGGGAGGVDWQAMDKQVAAWVQTQEHAPWMGGLKLLTQLGHLVWMAALGVVTSLCLLYRRAWLQMGAWVVGVAGVGLCVRWIKNSVARERPEVRWVLEQGYSFPSGHSAGTLVCYGLIVWLWWGMTHRTHRWPVALGAAGVVLAIGVSRVLLGAHYVSDVLAGWLLGLAWMSLVIAAADMAHLVAARRRQAG